MAVKRSNNTGIADAEIIRFLLTCLVCGSLVTWIPWTIGIYLSPYIWPSYYDDDVSIT
jgi:hypothetical protein